MKEHHRPGGRPRYDGGEKTTSRFILALLSTVSNESTFHVMDLDHVTWCKARCLLSFGRPWLEVPSAQ